MIATDEKALICDLAETYQIYNYKSLPISMVATLAVGLRDNSRIKIKMNDMRHSLETVLLAALVDRMSLLLWLNSKDGAVGVNKPESILEQLLGQEKEKEVVSFDSAEQFENEWKKLTKRGEK